MYRPCFILLLFLFTAVRLQAIEQHATIMRFGSEVSTAVTGAYELTFSGTLHFEHSMDELKTLGDSTPKIYLLEIKFKEGNKYTSVNTGFANNLDDGEGHIIVAIKQKLLSNNTNDYDFSYSLPVAAFKLSPGSHHLNPVITLTDEQTGRNVLRKEKIAPVTINMRPTIKIRLWVKHILVDSLDAEGNLWDYFIVNPKESNPDPTWSLDYAGRTYFTSKMRRNTFEYDDNRKEETYDLTITQGDILNIAVKDVDDLTTDDLIGTIIFSPLNPNCPADTVITATAGQIKSLEYSFMLLP